MGFEREELFKPQPNNKNIDMHNLRKELSLGLHNCTNTDRCLAWMITSGLVSPAPSEWKDQILLHYKDYMAYIRTFHIEKFEEQIFENSESNFGLPDNKLMDVIHRDIVRTGNQITCFPNPDPSIPNPKNSTLIPFSRHIRRVERALYVFGKLNAGLAYIQGFNEIICPLYYVFSSAADFFDNDYSKVEAMVFFMFQQLFSVTQLGDLYITKDHSSFILAKMAKFMNVLSKHHSYAASIIIKVNIPPINFALRWLNILFAQDYALNKLVLIWDSLFAHFYNFIEYSYYLAVSHLVHFTYELRPDDFISTMCALQKKHDIEVNSLLKLANRLWLSDHINEPHAI
ncbi:TBC1 domain protein, putative [Trichomonas vaginalis G3]|uniref:TBC1 domain protein, putative n=1 Tax=Trichomonas vaginalis (strain ATCC PRA-98 / G3) TaxID=412133 RepID=A2DVY3_TRIV3|nr:regulation of vesicle fusion [Trichomonas vaginalis G3]EAY15428.1 TBC1 domain protein, putative [Trichomonas vaginalis G3]KAI5499609.1 regulation of vesicle fusion [Trichomonas vaginalis G3]|eukprot:XP_001327651.1 TBC1 domain protein [Trichomonas vaginalis G3]